jgi:hypothetical protein
MLGREETITFIKHLSSDPCSRDFQQNSMHFLCAQYILDISLIFNIMTPTGLDDKNYSLTGLLKKKEKKKREVIEES